VVYDGLIERKTRRLLIRVRGNPVGRLLPLPEADRGNPFRALARALAFTVQLVDLLERQSLSLVDEEVDEGDAEEAGREPDEENLGLKVGVVRAVIDQVGGDESDDEVEKPLVRR
jgi:hypothetical protein